MWEMYLFTETTPHDRPYRPRPPGPLAPDAALELVDTVQRGLSDRFCTSASAPVLATRAATPIRCCCCMASGRCGHPCACCRLTRLREVSGVRRTEQRTSTRPLPRAPLHLSPSLPLSLSPSHPLSFSPFHPPLPSPSHPNSNPLSLSRYGDKELLVAALNKIKQAVRNACAADASLLPSLLQLAISDALSYREADGSGGLDSSILFELDRESSAGLGGASAAIKEMTQGLKRTTQASLADVLAIAGAETIEVVGGPRIVVQLGREDAKKAEAEVGRAGWSWEKPTAAGLRGLYAGTGLSAKDAVVLCGTVGSLSSTAAKVNAAKAAAAAGRVGDIDIDDDEDILGIDGDMAYGKADNNKKSSKLAVEVRGGTIGEGKFDTSYWKNILAKGAVLTPLDQMLLGDKEFRTIVEGYASGTKQNFREDLRRSYAKIQSLGANAVGAKMLLDASN